MKTITLIFFLFISINTYAQNPNIVLSQISNDILKQNKFNSEINIDYADIEGSPYLNENFSKSILIMENHEKIERELRYNIFNNALETIKEEKIFILYNKKIKEAIIDGKCFCFIVLDKSPSKIIVEKIYDHKLIMYLKHQVSFKKAQITKSHTAPKPNRFVNSTPKLYLKTPFNGSLIRIKKAKDFAKTFPRSSSKIKKFIKKNKIKINNKEQLIQLVRYIEEVA